MPSHPTGRPEVLSGAQIGSTKLVVEPDSVLLCKINPRINRTWVVGDFTPHRKIASTEWIVFPPNDHLQPKFLAYFLQQDALRDFLAANASGVGGSLMRVKGSTLRDFPFAYPGAVEQAALARELDEKFYRLEAGIAGLRRAQANLKRYRASVLKAACEGRLVPTEAELARQESRGYQTGDQLLEQLLEVRRQSFVGRGRYEEPSRAQSAKAPDGWAMAALEQVTAKIGDVDHKMPKPADSEIPYISTKDFYSQNGINFGHAKKISVADYEALCKKIRPELGDLLLSRYGTVGEVRLVEEDRAFQASYSIAILKTLGPHGLTKFLFYALQAEPVQTQIRRDVRASAQPDLGLESIRRFQLAVPPLAEQERIVSEIERRLSVADALEASITANLRRATRLRQSILQAAFGGSLAENKA
ncbi:MAG: restriction endonuclease subunit S [Fimbriimonadaceae bacterium]